MSITYTEFRELWEEVEQLRSDMDRLLELLTESKEGTTTVEEELRKEVPHATTEQDFPIEEEESPLR